MGNLMCCLRNRQAEEEEEEVERIEVETESEVIVKEENCTVGNEQTPCEINIVDHGAVSPHQGTSCQDAPELPSRCQESVAQPSAGSNGFIDAPKPSGIPLQKEYTVTAPNASPSLTTADEAESLSKDASSQCSMMELHSGMTLSMVTPAKELKGVTWIGDVELGETWIAPHNFNDGSFGLFRRVMCNNHPAVMKLQANSCVTRQEVTMLRHASPHPNILMLLAHARCSRTLVMVSAMALCDLTRLVDYLDGLDRTLVPFIIACIYCALRHLHRSFIAHRDVKDPNIVFLDDGTPQLADFGCASGFDRKNQRCPVNKDMIGTIGYLSPEAAHGVSTGPGQDFWSMGIVLCACINGNIPQDYIDKTLSLHPFDWSRSYNTDCLRTFRKLDLELIYNLLPEEHRVLRACFTEDPIVRIAEVETVMRSDYFSNFDLESIDSGYRHPQCHEELKVLLDQCCAAGENTQAYELVIPDLPRNTHFVMYSRHIIRRLFQTYGEAPLPDV